MMLTVKVIAAYLLDLLVGDPKWLPHPVVAMGKLITRIESWIRPVYQRFVTKGQAPRLVGRALGLVFPLVVVSLSFLGPYVLLQVLEQWSESLALLVEILLIATTVATKGLADAARDVYLALKANDLPLARKRLSHIVGRDTERLNEAEVIRGTVETVAENIVDAVTAPLFFAMIGGAPLAMAYRAVNTLDSMVGYKNEKYLHLGWASARLDDLCNWLPARLTFVVLITVAALFGLSAKSAWRIGIRDARKHPSPNSGWMEASVAGALHVQLGGVNYYQGKVSHRALMGDPDHPLKIEHIPQTIRLHFLTTLLFLVATGVLRLGVYG